VSGTPRIRDKSHALPERHQKSAQREQQLLLAASEQAIAALAQVSEGALVD
jgi:hypothetical protein